MLMMDHVLASGTGLRLWGAGALESFLAAVPGRA